MTFDEFREKCIIAMQWHPDGTAIFTCIHEPSGKAFQTLIPEDENPLEAEDLLTRGFYNILIQEGVIDGDPVYTGDTEAGGGTEPDQLPGGRGRRLIPFPAKRVRPQHRGGQLSVGAGEAPGEWEEALQRLSVSTEQHDDSGREDVAPPSGSLPDPVQGGDQPSSGRDGLPPSQEQPAPDGSDDPRGGLGRWLSRSRTEPPPGDEQRGDMDRTRSQGSADDVPQVVRISLGDLQRLLSGRGSESEECGVHRSTDRTGSGEGDRLAGVVSSIVRGIVRGLS